jgi:hypothetical protein
MSHALTMDGGSLVRHDYRQAVDEFYLWHKAERHRPPCWETLNAEDLRRYVNFLNHAHLSRVAIRFRLRALESFFDFLVRHGFISASPLPQHPLGQRHERTARLTRPPSPPSPSSKPMARPARGTSPALKARRQVVPFPEACASAGR